MGLGRRYRAPQEPHDKQKDDSGKLDDQQRQEDAQRNAHADYNEHEFGVMSNVGNRVPAIEKLTQLRDGNQEDGRNRDECVEPAVHLSIVTPHPTVGATLRSTAYSPFAVSVDCTSERNR